MLNFALNNDMPLLQKSAKKKGSQKLSFYYNFVKTFYWHKTFTGRWNKTVNIIVHSEQNETLKDGI